MKKLLLILMILALFGTAQAQYSMHDIWNRIVVGSDLTTQYGAMQTLLNSIFSSSDDALRIRIVGGDFQLTADGDTLTLDVADAARIIEYLDEGTVRFYLDSLGHMYSQHGTFDTVVVNKYFHELEVAVIDSIMSWISDGDTINVDASSAANFIEAKDGGTTVFWVDSLGNTGTTQTLRVGAANLTSPFHVLSTTDPQVTFSHTRGADSLTVGIDASGDATFAASGGDIDFSDDNISTTGSISDGVATINDGAVSGVTTLYTSGNAAFGRDDPYSRVHIESTTSPQLTISHTDDADSATVGVDANGYAKFTASGERYGFGGVPQAFFHVNPERDSGGDQDEDSTFVVTDRGWVGIGRINPTFMIHVMGNAAFFETDILTSAGAPNAYFRDTIRYFWNHNTIDTRWYYDTSTYGSLGYSSTDYFTFTNTNGLGIGTTDPDDFITGISATPVFTLTDSDINTKTSTSAEQADSAAIRLNASITEPQIQITQATGKNQRVTYALEGWITHDAASDTLTLGVVPANAFVTDVFIWTQEAFNSDGTDEVCVGYTGTVEAYGVDVDVASTGVEAVTLGSTSRTVDGTARTVQAYYHTSDATNLTTGEAHVIIIWTQATVNP